MTGGAAEDTPARPEGRTGASDTPYNAGRTSNRKRKQADFYNPGDVKTTEKLVIKEGEGLKLGSIPNVAFHLSKTTGSDELMEELHHILFKRKGKAQTRKRDILGFSGIVYEGDKEAERAKYAEKLGRLKLDDVHRLLDFMDIVPRGSGTKDAKVSTLLDFLEKPKALRDTNLAELAEKKKKKTKKGKEAPKTSRKKAPKKADDAADEEEEEEEAGEDDGKAAEDEQEDEPKPAAKKKAPPAKKKATPVTKKEEQPKKRKAGKEPATGKKKAKTEAKGGPEQAAQEPSDDALAAEIKAVVAGVNVQEFSLKDLMARLEEKFGVSLKKRKDFIKDTVAECTQSNEDAPMEEEGEKPEEPAQEAAEAEPALGEAATVPEAPKEVASEPAAEAAEEAAAEAMEEDAPAHEAAPVAAPTAAPEAASAQEPVLAEKEPIPQEAAAAARAEDAGNVAIDDKAINDMTADQAAASVAAQNVAEAAVEKVAAGNEALLSLVPAP